MLFVGGTAGQVVVLQFEQEEKEVDIKVLRKYHFLLDFTLSQMFVCFVSFYLPYLRHYLIKVHSTLPNMTGCDNK